VGETAVRCDGWRLAFRALQRRHVDGRSGRRACRSLVLGELEWAHGAPPIGSTERGIQNLGFPGRPHKPILAARRSGRRIELTHQDHLIRLGGRKRCERDNRMRRRRFTSLIGRAALAPLTALPVHADPPEGCAVPVARDDGWPVAAVNEDKLIDRGALCRMADRLPASSTANVHGVLVARGGKLLFERYFRGSDEIYSRRVGTVTFDADTLNDMKSVSKSVASLALGIAIDRGLIRSVNEPMFSFFPELSDLRSP